MINVELHSVATDASQKKFFAVLTAKIEGEARWLPVQVGAAEAVSIATKINEDAKDQPSSHDLLIRFVNQLGGNVDRIQLFRDSGDIQAKIKINGSDDEFATDARPSDALAVAAATGSEISVPETFLRHSLDQFEQYFENAHPSSEVTKLRHKLDRAIQEEDYELAAELESDLKSAKRIYEESMNLEDQVVDDLEAWFNSRDNTQTGTD